MRDDQKRRQVAEALERLRNGVASPRALALPASDRAVLEVAVERVRAQWLGPSEPVLTIALAGGTGAGKSTLINALAGQVIAEASEIRPTTRHLQVYHHRDDSLGTLTNELAGEATFVAHDRPELRLKMIVDAPDLDSFVVRHRATTRALLKRSGLVLYVFSPERYLEERTWSVLREETEFSACAAVLNKVDRVGSPEELEQVGEDLREHFASLGLGDIRIFRVCARAHVPEVDGTLPGPAPAVDDMVALRAFIERELQASEIAQLLRRQRVQGLARLRTEVDRAAPAAIPDELADLAEVATERAERAATRLADALADTLAAVESELAPLVTLRRHELFWGPFRTWLAVTDFLGFGLNSLAGRFLGRGKGDRLSVIQRILARGGETAVDDVLRTESRAIQDILYARGLPVERWRALTTTGDGSRVLAEVAAELEVHFDVTAAKIEPWRRLVIGAASTIGGLVPSAFVLAGLYVMGRDILTGGNAGLALLGRLGAMVILFFLALQGVVSATLPGGTRWLGVGVGPRAVRKVLNRTLGGWIAAYRADLAADVANLREPLALLQTELDAGDSLSHFEPSARLPHATPEPLRMTESP
jgi:hypothetical protein